MHFPRGEAASEKNEGKFLEKLATCFLSSSIKWHNFHFIANVFKNAEVIAYEYFNLSSKMKYLSDLISEIHEVNKLEKSIKLNKICLKVSKSQMANPKQNPITKLPMTKTELQNQGVWRI